MLTLRKPRQHCHARPGEKLTRAGRDQRPGRQRQTAHDLLQSFGHPGSLRPKRPAGQIEPFRLRARLQIGAEHPRYPYMSGGAGGGPAVSGVRVSVIVSNVAQQQMHVERGRKEFRCARFTCERAKRRSADALIEQFLDAQPLGVNPGARYRQAVVQWHDIRRGGADVDEETAAAAAPNRHNFMISLERALKETAVLDAAPPLEHELETAAGLADEATLTPDGLRLA